MPKKTRLSDISRAGQKPDEPSVIGAIRDPQFVRDVMAGLRDVSGRAIAGTVGAPVDLATMAMRPLGYSVPAEQVIGGSEWIGQKMQNAGMISPARNQLSELLAGLVTPDPVDAAKLGAMFIGPLAKTWDAEAAAKAARMELEGLDPRAIWAETGTWKGPEGKWRQEISDADALFNTSILNGKRVENPILTGHGNMDMGPTVGENAMLYHPELQNAYGRDLTKSTLIGSKNTMLGDGPQGAFDPTTSTLTLYAPATAETARSTALHELQHAIQQREGFARGGASSEFAGIDLASQSELDRVNAILNSGEYDMRDYDKLLQKKRDILNSAKSSLSPYEAYRRLAGEAEARATQARMGMTAAERRAKFPEESYDVPLSELIIRDQPIGRSMSTRQAPRDEAMRIAQANAAKPISEGGLGLPPDNTAMDRAKAMGFDLNVFHGSDKDIQELKKYSTRGGLGSLYVSDEPKTPNEYAMLGAQLRDLLPEHLKDDVEYLKDFYGDDLLEYAMKTQKVAPQRSPNVLPLMARSENAMSASDNFSDYGKYINTEYPEAIKQNWEDAFPVLGNDAYLLQNADPHLIGMQVTGDISDYTAAKRVPLIKFLPDPETGTNTFVIQDPSNIRSRFAAFDPARRYESDLLGAADPRLLGAIGLGTAGAIYKTNREKEKDRKREK